MAISLLGGMSKVSGMNPATVGMNTPTGNTQVPIYTPPIGVKAKTPAANVPAPSTTLPTAQKSPVQPSTLLPAPSQTQTSAPVSSTGNTQQNQPAPLSYPGLLGQLVGQQGSQNAQNANASVTGLQQTAQSNPGASGQAYQDYLGDKARYAKDAMDYNNTYNGLRTQAGIPLEFQTGRAGAFQLMNSGRLQAEQAAVSNDIPGINANISGTQTQQSGLNQAGGLALQGQGQQLGALQNAAGLAQPQLAGYNQQAFNPVTGQFGGGGTGGSLDSALQSVISGLQNHTMSYADAQAALSGYGQGGMNALTDWATKNNFNITQSNTLAGQQGSIGPAFDYAKTAMSNLETAVQGLGSLQSTNVPIINQLANLASGASGVNSQALQAYRGAIAEARSAIQKVLASVQGGTPTDYVGQSNALLPDDATPAQIAAAKSTLDTLGTAKQNIYGNPGQSGNTNQNASANLFSW